MQAIEIKNVWNLSLQEEHLMVDWGGNLDSSIGKSARLVIWRSEVRIPVQVQIFLLKILFVNYSYISFNNNWFESHIFIRKYIPYIKIFL